MIELESLTPRMTLDALSMDERMNASDTEASEDRFPIIDATVPSVAVVSADSRAMVAREWVLWFWWNVRTVTEVHGGSRW